MVPLDGSELAEAALPYVEYLALTFNSEVDLVGVCDQQGELDRLLQTYLDKLGSQISSQGIAVHSLILYGQPATEIIGYGEKNDIGLIIMAARGRSGVTRWDMGSVVDKVSKVSNIPLLLVRDKPSEQDIRDTKLINRIIVALDGSALGEAALPFIGLLASRVKADVLLLNVVSPALPTMATEAYYAGYNNELIDAQQAESQAYLKTVAAKFSEEGVNVNYQVLVGITSEKILEAVSQEKVNLIAMSTHGRTGISRWVYGSIAGKILSAATVPVLLVRASGMGVSR